MREAGFFQKLRAARSFYITGSAPLRHTLKSCIMSWRIKFALALRSTPTTELCGAPSGETKTRWGEPLCEPTYPRAEAVLLRATFPPYQGSRRGSPHHLSCSAPQTRVSHSPSIDRLPACGDLPATYSPSRAHVKPLRQALIIGSWRVIREEPPVTRDFTTERFLHFTADGRHYWEHPFVTFRSGRICHFRYHMTERGVFITPRRQQKGWEISFSADGDCLVVSHGHKRWWIQRIPAAERPGYLSQYCELPAET